MAHKKLKLDIILSALLTDTGICPCHAYADIGGLFLTLHLVKVAMAIPLTNMIIKMFKGCSFTSGKAGIKTQNYIIYSLHDHTGAVDIYLA